MLPMSGLTPASLLSVFPGLPVPVVAYIEGSNGFDLNAVAATFAGHRAGERSASRSTSACRQFELGGMRDHQRPGHAMEVIGTAIRGNNIASASPTSMASTIRPASSRPHLL